MYNFLSANQKTKSFSKVFVVFVFLRGNTNLNFKSFRCQDPDSNWRHEDFQSTALPTELSRLYSLPLDNKLNRFFLQVLIFMFPNNKTFFLKKLANLQLAIGLLITIGVMLAFGTIIEQNQNLAFYKENYPELNPVLGFLSWKVIKSCSLDNVYTAWWFILVLLLFASSLLACTFTTQLPSLKTFKLWKFNARPLSYDKAKLNEEMTLGFSNAIAFNCNEGRYHFFRQYKKGYAYSGLLGRVAPIIVHASIILLLIGSTFGAFVSYTSQEIVSRGEIFHIQNLTTFGDLSYIQQNFSCRINNFWITYTKGQKTDQFYSDLSILDQRGNELKRKTIFVNEPLAFKNLMLYQTDWDIVGLKLKLNNKKIFEVPLRKITKDGTRFWFGSLNLDSILTKKLTVVINDLNNIVYIYDEKGILMNELSVGDFIPTTNNFSIQISDFITSTGLQIKSDSSIIIVYFSFFLLILSIYISFFTYSQGWLVELSKDIKISGSSNRSVLFFQEDFRKIIKRSRSA